MRILNFSQFDEIDWTFIHAALLLDDSSQIMTWMDSVLVVGNEEEEGGQDLMLGGEGIVGEVA